MERDSYDEGWRSSLFRSLGREKRVEVDFIMRELRCEGIE